jgi:hypothetical protein
MTTLFIFSQLAISGGVIEFHDYAPPPTAEQKAQAKLWEERVKTIAVLLDKLAPTIKATFVLRNILSNMQSISSEALDNLSQQRSNWNALSKSLIYDHPFNNKRVIDSEKAREYIVTTLNLEKIIKKAKHVDDDTQSSLQKEFSKDVETFLKIQAEAFDSLIAERGILNMRIGTYPYNSVESQPPLSCELVNNYSKSFKCIPKDISQGKIENSSWLFGSVIDMGGFWKEMAKANDYVKEQPETLKLVVYTPNLLHTYPQIDGALIDHPFSMNMINPIGRITFSK